MEEKVKIGLEVHCQITSLKSKLFCSCPSDYRGKPPNTVVCPVCLGLPGSLPVLNWRAVELAARAALALNCKVSKRTLFMRKNYFYPDLPKNFQISQYDRAGGAPIGSDGHVTFMVEKQRKTVRIRRVHLEEDPGKLAYKGTIDTSPYTLVDYNRAGVALLEIVTEPDLSSPREARAFLQKLRSILEHIEVFDGSLEGAMRCDANISLEGGSRVEIKNISSFKDVEKALNFEIVRQRELLKKGGKVRSETRHWDEARGVTFSLRVKEEEQDYRYFPEPDLTPIELSDELLEKLRREMPELPDARKERLMRQYGLPEYDAEVLTSDRRMADFFEEAVRLGGKPKAVANWLMGDVLQVLYSLGQELPSSKLTPAYLAELTRLVETGEISIKIAKKVLWETMKTGMAPSAVVKEKGWKRLADEAELRRIVETVFAENPKAVEDALRDPKAAHFLVGKVMEKTRGMADPELTYRLVSQRLEKLREGKT
ncbi:Asp-tRNA(Asn)/Glu-tRNA(Gln) amidotransferase GatCAB subunit B [Candidatus Bathyarchaeota archaeon]|nr:MAG: Asp-tRNA(Asn)/Glu-tRNA(Gln) amidotransferase GatCAB subunit B [Candidatus Bathyarchaeota archaeon]